MILSPSKAALRRVKRRDRLARWVVTLGGMLVIASVLAILLLIVGTTLPLAMPANVGVIAQRPLPAAVRAEDVLAVGVDSGVDHRSMLVAHLLTKDGTVTFLDLNEGKVLAVKGVSPDAPGKDSQPSPPPPLPKGERGGSSPSPPTHLPKGARGERTIRAVQRTAPGCYSATWSDGK